MADKRDNEKLNPVQAQKFLSGMDYPADKQEILEHAKEHGADKHVMEFFERLPDREYEGPNGVSKEIGKIDREIGSKDSKSR